MSTVQNALDVEHFVAPADAGTWAAIRGALRSWPITVGGGVLLLWVVVAVTIPLWAWAGPRETVGERLAPPNASQLLGTDALGRDVLIRTLYGARDSMPAAGRRDRADGHHRDGPRRSRRLHRRCRRERDHALHGRRARLPPDLPGDGRRRRPRTRSPQHRDRPRARVVADLRPVAPGSGDDDQEPRTRRGRHRRRCATSKDPAPPRAAVGDHTGDDQRHDGLRPGVDLHRLAELPRSGRHSPVARVGPRDRRRDAELLPVVDLARSRPRHPQRRPRSQLPR